MIAHLFSLWWLWLVKLPHPVSVVLVAVLPPTLLWGSAWGLARCLRRSSAAVRYWVWILATIALLLPFLSRVCGLEWHPINYPDNRPLAGVTVDYAPAPAPVMAAVPWPKMQPYNPVDAKDGLLAADSSTATSDEESGWWEIALKTWSWVDWFSLFWIAVAGGLGLRIMAGLLALRWLRKGAVSAGSKVATGLLEQAAREIHLRRVTRVIIAPRVNTPMTWGFLRATVALPEQALNWQPEALRMVLLHEFAHIKRGDFFTQILAHLTAAIYWFHPLGWLALRELRLEREMACDDLVLGRMKAPADYAEKLLEFSRILQRRMALPGAAITMVRRSQIEQRLQAILDASRRRCGVRWRLWAPVSVLLLTAMLLLWLARPGFVQSHPSAGKDLPAEYRIHLEKLMASAEAQDVMLKTLYVESEMQGSSWDAGKKNWKEWARASEAKIWVSDDGRQRKFRADFTPEVMRTDDASHPIYVQNAIYLDDGATEWEARESRLMEPRTQRDEARIFRESGEEFLSARTNRQFHESKGVPNFKSDALRMTSIILTGGLRDSFRTSMEMIDGESVLRVDELYQDSQRISDWFAPDKNYALVKHELAFPKQSNQPAVIFQVKEFQQVAPGFWFPKRVVATYDGHGERIEYRYKTVKVEPELAASTFEYHPENERYTAVQPKIAPADLAKDAVNLQVLDQTTHKPLAKAALVINLSPTPVYCGSPIPEAKAVTDEQGKYIIHLPIEGVQFLQVYIRNPEHVGMCLRWEKAGTRAQIPKNVSAELEPSVPVDGFVQDEQGKPISHAKVEMGMFTVTGPLGEFARMISLSPSSIETDAHGHWSSQNMPGDLSSFSVKLSHPDYLSDPMFESAENTAKKIAGRTFWLVMKKGVKLSGRVVSKTGAPVAGAEVRQGRDRWGTDYPVTKTDHDGFYTFPNTAPGETVLTVQTKGFAPETQTLKVAGKDRTANFVLPPPVVLKLKLVDATGKPLANVDCGVDSWRDRNRALGFRVGTDAQGEVIWDSAPADALSFDFLYKDQAMRDMRITANGKEQVIVFHPALAVTARVMDAKTGRQIPNFKVEYGIRGPGDENTDWMLNEDRTFANGAFIWNFESLHWVYQLRVKADGYEPVISRLLEPKEQTASLDFALNPAAR